MHIIYLMSEIIISCPCPCPMFMSMSMSMSMSHVHVRVRDHGHGIMISDRYVLDTYGFFLQIMKYFRHKWYIFWHVYFVIIYVLSFYTFFLFIRFVFICFVSLHLLALCVLSFDTFFHYTFCLFIHFVFIRFVVICYVIHFAIYVSSLNRLLALWLPTATEKGIRRRRPWRKAPSLSPNMPLYTTGSRVLKIHRSSVWSK